MSKVLIIKPSSLGDIIHGLQVAQSICEQLPGARISWVAADNYFQLVKDCHCVDRVLMFERHGGMEGFCRLIKEIRQKRYDWVLDMQGLARSGMMTLLSRGCRKIGRSDAREGSRWVYHRRAALPTCEKPHAVDILLQLLPLMGLEARLGSPLRFDVQQPAVRLPMAFSHSLLVFPESRREEKVWPHFAALTEVLAAGHPEHTFVWCGSERIRPHAPQRDNVLNLAGHTSLPEIVWLLQHGGGVFCNDSGPMHLAAALGKPVFALFGPTEPERYGPYPLDSTRHFVLRALDGDMESLKMEDVREAAFARFMPAL